MVAYAMCLHEEARAGPHFLRLPWDSGPPKPEAVQQALGIWPPPPCNAALESPSALMGFFVLFVFCFFFSCGCWGLESRHWLLQSKTLTLWVTFPIPLIRLLNYPSYFSLKRLLGKAFIKWAKMSGWQTFSGRYLRMKKGEAALGVWHIIKTLALNSTTIVYKLWIKHVKLRQLEGKGCSSEIFMLSEIKQTWCMSFCVSIVWMYMWV